MRNPEGARLRRRRPDCEDEVAEYLNSEEHKKYIKEREAKRATKKVYRKTEEGLSSMDSKCADCGVVFPYPRKTEEQKTEEQKEHARECRRIKTEKRKAKNKEYQKEYQKTEKRRAYVRSEEYKEVQRKGVLRRRVEKAKEKVPLEIKCADCGAVFNSHTKPSKRCAPCREVHTKKREEKYRATEGYKKMRRIYSMKYYYGKKSEKRKSAVKKKYQQSEKGRETTKKYEESEKCKARVKEYNQSESRKASQRESNKKYQQGEEVKERRRIQAREYRRRKKSENQPTID